MIPKSNESPYERREDLRPLGWHEIYGHPAKSAQAQEEGTP